MSNKVLGCDWTPVWTACVGPGLVGGGGMEAGLETRRGRGG